MCFYQNRDIIIIIIIFAINICIIINMSIKKLYYFAINIISISMYKHIEYAKYINYHSFY